MSYNIFFLKVRVIKKLNLDEVSSYLLIFYCNYILNALNISIYTEFDQTISFNQIKLNIYFK